MKIWLIFFLFNTHTGSLSPDSTWVATYSTPDECYSAAVNTGPQKPNKAGDIKVFACELAPPSADQET